jgi:hypothetical protein
MVAALAATAGCGGGSSHRAASRVFSPLTSSTTVRFSGSGSSRFCDLARTLAQKTQIGPDLDLRRVYQDFDAEAGQIQAAAPAAIKADVATVVARVRTLKDALVAVDYDEAKLDPSSLKSLQDPRFQQAAARVSAYSQQVCRVGGATSSSRVSGTSAP